MAKVVDTGGREELAEVKESALERIYLYGEYRFKVDGKGRVALPTKFRKALPNELVIAQDLHDECLCVFVKSDFKEWVESLFARSVGDYDVSSVSHNSMMRKLLGRARDVEVDGTGRIMLASDLRQAVGIDKDVVLVANKGRFEIWDAKRYDEIDESIDLSQLMHG